MKYKTISGHCGTVFSLAHNNREFTPNNVDPFRTVNNYDCVASGKEVLIGLTNPRHVSEFWRDYRDLADMYWEDRSIAYVIHKKNYKEKMQKLRQWYRLIYPIPHNDAEAFLAFLLLPLTVVCGIVLTAQQIEAKREWEEFKSEQWARDMEMKIQKRSFRSSLRAYDWSHGTAYLGKMDALVKEMAEQAKNHIRYAEERSFEPTQIARYATLEEIYERFYEPSFQAFQAKQRPCRRYNGTYLEQIRERRQEAIKNKNTKADRVRATAEAIEIVFGIGDMDNTGYERCPDDAKKSELLLKDYADYLMKQPNICFVTTRELNNPQWEPPFKNGLIVLNLNVHCDEATPGIHLTCIPYSRGCKRGPEVQAALGRAMTGMGYPSTWIDALDENGERIPKRDKAGEVIHNADGTVRYKQEPEGQGIIDWIEEQKRWIQNEMGRRYGWQREYKGSHPRGNLSTPEYKVARAKERQEEIERTTQRLITECAREVDALTYKLDQKVSEVWEDNPNNTDLIINFLKVCPIETYREILKQAAEYLDRMPEQKRQKALAMLIAQANEQRKEAEKKYEQPTGRDAPTR